jgi:hypothetical protein
MQPSKNHRLLVCTQGDSLFPVHASPLYIMSTGIPLFPLVLAHYWYQFSHSYFDHDHPPDTFKRFPLFWVHTSKRFD